MYQVPSTLEEHKGWRTTGDLYLHIVAYSIEAGVKSGLVLGPLYGTIVYPIIGTIIGAILGLVGGVLLGLLSGIALAGVTQGWFYPTAKIATYGKVMLGVVSAVNLLAGVCIGLIVPVSENGMVALNLGETIVGLPTDRLPLHWVVLPTIIAALVPLYWRPRYILWYVQTM